jgi:hypothetical protein
MQSQQHGALEPHRRLIARVNENKKDFDKIHHIIMPFLNNFKIETRYAKKKNTRLYQTRI